MVGVGVQDIGDKMGLAMIITAIECCIPQAIAVTSRLHERGGHFLVVFVCGILSRLAHWILSTFVKYFGFKINGNWLMRII